MGRTSIRYLILPGWHGSPDDHWQSHWQRLLPNSARVEQADWHAPQKAAWIAALDQAVEASSEPTVLVAHSLGCVTVAHWAAQASAARVARVRGALLVAPADVERPGCPDALRDFAPLPRARLPFPSVLIGSDNDPAMAAERAVALGRAWGSDVTVLPNAGHINVASGHRHWERGFAHLYRLQRLIESQLRRTA